MLCAVLEPGNPPPGDLYIRYIVHKESDLALASIYFLGNRRSLLYDQGLTCQGLGLTLGRRTYVRHSIPQIYLCQSLQEAPNFIEKEI